MCLIFTIDHHHSSLKKSCHGYLEAPMLFYKDPHSNLQDTVKSYIKKQIVLETKLDASRQSNLYQWLQLYQ